MRSARTPRAVAGAPGVHPIPLGSGASAQFQSEHVLQIAVAEYLAVALPATAWASSIDHAGRGPRDGARMKRRGVRKGLPDILVLWDRETIWIELKAKSGLTLEQRDFFASATLAGHHTAVCRSVAAVEQALRGFGIPLRARAA